MNILRIVNVQINSSTSISIKFTENLVANLVPANISIISQVSNAPDSQVLKVLVQSDILTVMCQPLTPLVAYEIQLQSTVSNPFISINGDAKISEDGVSNIYLFNGPMSPDNPVSNYLNAFYQNNIYNITDDSNSVISKYLQSISINFARALYDIGQVKNENYLSFTIGDELHTRGTGPFDRLYEEAAYDVFRVSLGPTKALTNTSFVFSDFPYYPITLQRQLITETIKASSTDQNGTFNINTLTFNLSNNPITRVDSIIFNFTTTHPVYNYDIEQLGYQILDSRYDQEFASSYLLLNNNQIKINDKVLQDPNFTLDQLLNITIKYEYKNLGIQVDNSSLNVFTTLLSTREVLPPIVNIFTLQHAPITDSSNNIPTLNGVIFTDPNSNTGSPHPAFVNEIPFRLSALPSTIGQYAIDYPNATVYVYGASTSNDGTGPSPPLATYYYKFTYTSEIDYVYDSDLLDLVALPNGNLINSTGSINFNFEKVLIPGIDYIADTHLESINERINNQLIALNVLTTQNSPITNVFQVLNETSGEIYTIDRWNDNKVYFRYNNPPRLPEQLGESTIFEIVPNELLTINNSSININSLNVATIFLANDNIISSTQDGIASSVNTSLVFTDSNIFINEKWYNQEFTATDNINRLSSLGQYTVDYLNGIVYVAINTSQNNLGTATYKKNNIVPNFPHIISVNDIYYRISILEPKNKKFQYVSFENNSIIPKNLDASDEAFLNGTTTAPYQIFQNMIGTFNNGTFIPGLTNAIKFVRSITEYNDLLNSTNPLNFATVSSATPENFTVNVNAINKQSFENIQFDGTNYFINLNENIPYLSPGIIYTFSIVRVSDSQSLWNNTGTIVPGNPLKLILPGFGSPQIGDLVNVNYSFQIIPLERVVIDYNKGDLFVDYTYLADEILVSYEYGDNVIDFRTNTNLPAGTQYYVSYKAGALRDALLKNFGTLVNVPDLSTFDLSLERERYRDALLAALSSFIQGPTIDAIKNIGQTISHVEPEVIESAFEAWSLGSSLLFPNGVETTGDFQLLPAHFNNGVLVNDSKQTITLPINSNLRLEEGSFETWIFPQWNGIDNDTDLTFNITRDGYSINPLMIFIGAGEYHPSIVNNNFTINKLSQVSGHPNTNKDGIFIYYDKDLSGNFNRWYLEVIDGYVDGYIDGYSSISHVYKMKITSNGKFYDVKSINNIKPSNLSIFTGTNTVNLTINGYNSGIDEGITFISDLEHYILDLGAEKNNSRLSIFKDVSGYLNFRVYDRNKIMYSISADVSSWKNNQLHMVGASWKLNTRNSQDEMHLFIDGLEVPNIIKYGQKLQPYLHEKFRTVNPEEIVGSSTRDIVGSTDLSITQGSDIVSSSLNFSSFNIFPGDTIFIDEIGFSISGYTINNVNGQNLTLSSPMPLSLQNGNFSINRTEFTVISDINVVPNIAVSTIHTFLDGYDLQTTSGLNTVSSATNNFSNLGVLPGFLLRIDNPSFELIYTITQVSGHNLTISDPSPISLTAVNFQIYNPNAENEIPGKRALFPAYSISQDANFDNILTISNDVLANDLILIRTLGLNNKGVKKQYYTWSDGYENVIMTQLPAPISLDEVKITKIIVPTTVIGPSNSTYSAGTFTSNHISTAQPSNIQTGRTIQATIAGTNTNFSPNVQVIIHGMSGAIPISETINFQDYGTLDFVQEYTQINYIQVIVAPINSIKNALTVEIREKFSITQPEFSGTAPTIRYSYSIGGGNSLSANGFDNLVSDSNNLFSGLDFNNYLIINSPPTAAGYYKITGLSSDRHSISISPTNHSMSVPLPAFTNGSYQILNVSAARTGLQNGFFTLEISDLPGTPYLLSSGFYELQYSTYMTAKFKPLNGKLYIGSDFNGSNQANCIIDQSTLYSIMLSDTRVGEVVSENQLSITKDFNLLKAPKPNRYTLAILPFDSFPFQNTAQFYTNFNATYNYFQSDFAVNDNFGQSAVILDKPIVLSNTGILDAKKQGTIEFWMSPIFDTNNDPQDRYYVDAYSAIVEEATSLNNTSVKVSASASQILKVVLASGDPKIDYFAGGKLEIDTQQAIQENAISIGNGTVIVAEPALQVMSVKIIGDLTGKDYFGNNGVISPDFKTLYLGTPLPINNAHVVITYKPISNKNNVLNTQIIRLNKELPAQNSKVIITYIPSGMQGDRISIFKDKFGFMNFSILASGINFTVRGPTVWPKHTWHRVKASYKINGGLGNDEIRLFLDGYQYSNNLLGNNLIFGDFPNISGSVIVGDGYSLNGNIIFKDPINEIFIGSDFNRANPIFTLIDNFRISNISRPIYSPYGEPLDVNYSNNLSTVFPITQDLYTTLLLDFDENIEISNNFATLIDRETGAFDFTVNIFDSFGIISSSAKVKEVLENLINILKPANTRVFIKYIT